MDALERKVTKATSEVAQRYKQEQFLNRALEAWRVTTGLAPAYAEVLAMDPESRNYPRVAVEVDGIKIIAAQKYSKTNSITGFHQWDIAETFTGRGVKRLGAPALTLEGLAPYLPRRRKRLKKRGMYEGN